MKYLAIAVLAAGSVTSAHAIPLYMTFSSNLTRDTASGSVFGTKDDFVWIETSFTIETDDAVILKAGSAAGPSGQPLLDDVFLFSRADIQDLRVDLGFNEDLGSVPFANTDFRSTDFLSTGRAFDVALVGKLWEGGVAAGQFTLGNPSIGEITFGRAVCGDTCFFEGRANAEDYSTGGLAAATHMHVTSVCRK